MRVVSPLQAMTWVFWLILIVMLVWAYRSLDRYGPIRSFFRGLRTLFRHLLSYTGTFLVRNDDGS